MAETKTPRKYELRRRADAMETTRRRITQAAVELHGRIGPARTTIAGVAELAGVQRHTVYRHFPTEEELFAACSSEYWGHHPWPDVMPWKEIGSPSDRLTTALTALYGYYETVEQMLTNALRDAATVPLVERSLQPFTEYLDDVAAVLIDAYAPQATEPVLLKAAVHHAVEFPTWRSLIRRQGLQPEAAVTLLTRMVGSTIP
jgi:AcrR family transcriptional regulator